MKRLNVTACALLAAAFAAAAEDAPAPPMMPEPQAEHAWLEQLAGEWTFTSEADMGPGVPPMKSEGTESVRVLGGFWLVAEGQTEAFGQPMTTILTLGYDASEAHYTGSWIGSCMDQMWVYEGALNEDKTELALMTEGPNMIDPSVTAKYKEVMKIVDEDHRTFTSYMQGEDGAWTAFVKSEYTRKK